MNKCKYIYMVINDWYGFTEASEEEILFSNINSHGDIRVIDLNHQRRTLLLNYRADKSRLYKVKELK